MFRLIDFLKKIYDSSTDKFLSPLTVSDWLVFYRRNLLPHYRYTNADLKSSSNVCVPIRIFLIVGILKLFTCKVCDIFVLVTVSLYQCILTKEMKMTKTLNKKQQKILKTMCTLKTK